jgi:hypothetical protein
MEDNPAENNIQEVRIVATDKAAISKMLHKFELFICIVFTISIAITIYAFCFYIPQSNDPIFHSLLLFLIITGIVILIPIHFIGPYIFGNTEVLVGSDFIAGPNPASLLRFIGRKIIIKYKNITAVSLKISKGRIIGATIIGKNFVTILIQHVTEPVNVIKAIRDNTGPEVKWHRSSLRSTKLSMDDVDSLIDSELTI